MGANYLTAKNGKEAVQICNDNPTMDLVLMDIKMPEMDGYEATNLIKKENENIIIVAQTAHAIVGDKEKALRKGFDNYISKPIKADELLSIIKTVFEK